MNSEFIDEILTYYKTDKIFIIIMCVYTCWHSFQEFNSFPKTNEAEIRGTPYPEGLTISGLSVRCLPSATHLSETGYDRRLSEILRA